MNQHDEELAAWNLGRFSVGVSETTTCIIIPHQPHCILSLITLPTLSYFRRDSSYILQPSDAHIFLSLIL